MLDKKDMLTLIEANDNFMALNDILAELVPGGQLREDKYAGLYKISDMIFRHCSFYKEGVDAAFARFMKIAFDHNLTPEEKCERLT